MNFCLCMRFIVVIDGFPSTQRLEQAKEQDQKTHVASMNALRKINESKKYVHKRSRQNTYRFVIDALDHMDHPLHSTLFMLNAHNTDCACNFNAGIFPR